MDKLDQNNVRTALDLISLHISSVLDTPDIKDYIGLVLDWELRQVDDLIQNVLENIDG